MALMHLIRAFRQAAADVVQSLGRATLGLGDAFAEPVRDPGDLAAEPLQRQGVLIVGLSQALVHRLGVASQIALQLLFQRGHARVGRPCARRLDLLHPAVQVAGDAHDLVAHALDRGDRALLGGAGLLADRGQGALDPLDAAFGFGRIQAAHHLDAAGFHLPGESLRQLFKARGFARVVRLDAALGVAHPQVEGRERPLQSLERF